MKKWGLFILILALVQINAQNLKIGATGNIHKGSIVKVHDKSEGKWGGGIGMFAEIPLVENDIFDSAWLYFSPQIEYSMQGENADANPKLFDKQVFSHDYVNVNGYIKYFFHKNNYKSSFFVFAGPKVEFLVREDRDVPKGYDDIYYDFNKDDKVNGIGFGVSAGAGLKLSNELEAFLRYDRSFSKVYDHNDRKTYNRMIALGINYIFYVR